MGSCCIARGSTPVLRRRTGYPHLGDGDLLCNRVLGPPGSTAAVESFTNETVSIAVASKGNRQRHSPARDREFPDQGPEIRPSFCLFSFDSLQSLPSHSRKRLDTRSHISHRQYYKNNTTLSFNLLLI